MALRTAFQGVTEINGKVLIVLEDGKTAGGHYYLDTDGNITIKFSSRALTGELISELSKASFDWPQIRLEVIESSEESKE